MPVGTDIISWAPRVGSTGDDRYTLDPNGDMRWFGEATANYSSTPTLAQVQAGTGINQILAHIQQRQALLNTFGSFLPSGSLSALPPYLGKQTGDLFRNLGLRTYINEIRAKEGRTAYTWTGSAPNPITAQEIFDLRKALATDYFIIGSTGINAHGQYVRATTYPPDPLGTFSTLTGSFDVVPQVVGQRCNFGGGISSFRATRRIQKITLPSYMGDFNTAAPVWMGAYGVGFDSTLPSYFDATFEMWKCASNYAAMDATAFADLGTSLASQVIVSGTAQANFEFTSVSALPVTLTAGSSATFLFCTAEERTDNNQGGAGSNWSSQVVMNQFPPAFKIYT